MSAVALAIQQLRAAVEIERAGMRQSVAMECIESICGIIRELKAHFNAFLPIFRLPEAVLTMIFKFAAFDDAVDTLEACTFRRDVNFKTLRSLTHVCTEWRCIALNYPALWTRLTVQRFRNQRLFEALVMRTKSMPLDVNLVIDQYGFKCDGNCYFKDYASRTRHLQISILHSDGVRWIAKVLSRLSFTSLECLKISCSPSVTCDQEFLSPESLAKVLIGGQEVSHLKALALDAIQILPFVLGNHFPDLIHVHMRMKGVDMDKLFHFLSHSPKIESFTLQGVRSVFDRERDGCGPIVMSNMKIVHFESSEFPSAIKILSYLSLPSCALIRLDNVSGFEDPPEDAADALTPVFDKAQVSVHSATHIEIGTVKPGSEFLLVDTPSGRIWLSALRALSKWELSDLLGLRDIVSLSSVTSLVLDVYCWASHEPAVLFEAFPCLVDLSLRIHNDVYVYGDEPGPQYFIHALASSPTVCPSLRSLSIAWDAMKCARISDASKAGMVDFATELIALAKGRNAAGARLWCLTVQLHQMELFREEDDERILATFEMYRKLFAPLMDIVEEFKYMEPGIKTIQFGKRMADRYLPDDKYWDIMRHPHWC